MLGTGGIFCFYIALSITPLITLTGAQWIAPLRRWYGIWFAIIGIADTTTAAITTDFAGGVFGRLAGHTFLLTGFFIITLALPVLATANTPAQRKTREVLEAAAADDLRHLVLRRRAPAAARRVQALRRS